MKTLLNKLLRLTGLLTIALVILIACEKKETPPAPCVFNDALTDLPWLKEKVESIVATYQDALSVSAAIDQCIYGDQETGFLIDQDSVLSFYNCEGEMLSANESMEAIVSGWAITSRERIWEWRSKYPIDVPFTEYLFEDLSCQWKDYGPDRIVLINSEEELRNHLECRYSPDSGIDFSTQTLVLAYGLISNFVRTPDSIRLQQLSEQSYHMEVNFPEVPGYEIRWSAPVLIPKIPGESTVELIVTRTEETINPLTDYLAGEWMDGNDPLKSIILTFYPDQNKFYQQVPPPKPGGLRIIFFNDTWAHYELHANMMFCN